MSSVLYCSEHKDFISCETMNLFRSPMTPVSEASYEIQHFAFIFAFGVYVIQMRRIVFYKLIVLRGLVVIVSAKPKVCGFKPGRGRRIFKGNKTPQHTFLRR
jgi:hypothetical protein